MSKQPKRRNKSKAELEQEMKIKAAQEAQRKETERRRALAKDIFYPMLLKHAKNIRHAQQICKIIEQAIMTLHNNELTVKSLGDLKLVEHFGNDKDEAHAAFLEILEAFKDEKLVSCIEIIGGMPGAIDSFLAQDSANRPLTELKTYFL